MLSIIQLSCFMAINLQNIHNNPKDVFVVYIKVVDLQMS